MSACGSARPGAGAVRNQMLCELMRVIPENNMYREGEREKKKKKKKDDHLTLICFHIAKYASTYPSITHPLPHINERLHSCIYGTGKKNTYEFRCRVQC